MAGRVPQDVVEVIRRKMGWYCRYADCNQWDQFDSNCSAGSNICLLQSGWLLRDSRRSKGQAPAAYNFKSRDEFASFFQNSFASLQTTHLVDGGDFEQTGHPDEVRAIFVEAAVPRRP